MVFSALNDLAIETQGVAEPAQPNRTQRLVALIAKMTPTTLGTALDTEKLEGEGFRIRNC